jgi:signal transduction histidine kinase
MGLTDDARVGRLLALGRELVAELDTERVLQRVLEEARALTGARYAALGVLNEDRRALERFITSGMEESVARGIGDPPHGRGILGLLIEAPHPLRLDDVQVHPQSYGFPPGHPPMATFLGVPVPIRGEAWGNLYLTEKAGGETFNDADEEAVSILAAWAGTAIDNARLYQSSEQRRQALERAVRSLEASRDITSAIASTAELEGVLELIVKRGRALVEARSVLIMLREGDELVIAAGAGHALAARGHRLPILGSTAGQVLTGAATGRYDAASAELLVAPETFGVAGARTALFAPMTSRGLAVGVLTAFDRGPDRGPFTSEDEQLLRNFANSAANAVLIKRSVEADRLRSAIDAADEERRRFARELHDQTLQALGALRIAMAAALRRGTREDLERALRRAVHDTDSEIANLRGIIADLRPSLLDDLGLRPALVALVEARRERGLDIRPELELPDSGEDREGYPRDLETAVYRVVQEALTNVKKHAGASRVTVRVAAEDGELVVVVEDDGVGFDTEERTPGFGLAGMRERVYLTGGSIDITSGSGGTLVRARFPVNGGAGLPAAG